MPKKKMSLEIQLVLASLVAALVTILAGGIVIYKIAEGNIKQSTLHAVRDLATYVEGISAGDADSEDLSEGMVRNTLIHHGSSWIMGSDGMLVASPDSKYRQLESEDRGFGSLVIKLDSAKRTAFSVDRSFTSQIALEKIFGEYTEGFGTYSPDGIPKLVAFKVIGKGKWLVGIDEPAKEAYTTLGRLKYQIQVTSITIAFLIVLFSFFINRMIIKPYYRDQEEVNLRMFRLNRDLRKLSEVTHMALQPTPLEERFEGILDATQQVLGLDRINVLVLTQDKEKLRLITSVGSQEGEGEPQDVILPITPAIGSFYKAFTELEPIFFDGSGELPDDLRMEEPYSNISFFRSRAFVVLPLVIHGHCVGVVGADNYFSRRPISSRVMEVMEIFTNILSLTIEHDTLFTELKQIVNKLEITDAVTRLYNSSHFSARLNDLIDDFESDRKPLSMALFHIPNFKEYNEKMGGQMGDVALRVIADNLRGNLDRNAILARLYGATFAILHKGKNSEDVLGSIQAVGENVRNLDVEGATDLAASGFQVRFQARDFSPDIAKDGSEFLLKVESELKSP